MHNSDIGFQGSSDLDGSWMKFISDGPGVAGFKFEVDSEEDGDAAAQFLAGAEKARVEEGDFRVSARHSRELSLEALEDLGCEFAADDREEDWLDEDDGYPDEDGEEDVEQPPEGVIRLFRDGEFQEITPRRERPGNGRLYREMVLKPRLEAMRLVSRVLKVASPAKDNGKPTATPPVGKFLKGVVIGSGPLGLLVEIEGGTEVRIAVADEFGHGSQTKALQWLHSHTVGQKVRLRVKYVNGAVYGVLTREKHPRPWQCRQPVTGKEVEARPAN